MLNWFRNKPAPIIAAWSDMEQPVIQLGMLGREGVVNKYELLLPAEYPGQVVVRWQEVKRRRSSEQAFAVREKTGPQCPHCTALQLLVALATALGLPRDAMVAPTQAYDAILARMSTPTYMLAFEDNAWRLGCKSHEGGAHTKYDCSRHAA